MADVHKALRRVAGAYRRRRAARAQERHWAAGRRQQVLRRLEGRSTSGLPGRGSSAGLIGEWRGNSCGSVPGIASLASALLFRARNLLHGVCPSHAACYSGRRCKHCKEMLIVMRARGMETGDPGAPASEGRGGISRPGPRGGVAGGWRRASHGGLDLYHTAPVGPRWTGIPADVGDRRYLRSADHGRGESLPDRPMPVGGRDRWPADGALSGVVQLVQEAARAAADGMYGPGTESAVNTWQSQHELTADGIAGPATMGAMSITRNHQCSGPPSGSPSPGSSSSAQLQWDLAGLGYLSWSGIDGIVGPQTQSATQAFQTDRCLSVDGIAGPQTNGALASIINSVQQVAGTTQDGAYGPNTRAAVASWQARARRAGGRAGRAGHHAEDGGITRVAGTAPARCQETPGPGAGRRRSFMGSGRAGDRRVGHRRNDRAADGRGDRGVLVRPVPTVDGIAGPQTTASWPRHQSLQQVAGATEDGGDGPSTKAAVASGSRPTGYRRTGKPGRRPCRRWGSRGC